jgi:hypothetical protein
MWNEPGAVPETDTLKFPCWAKGVANTAAGKSETNTTSNATAILQRSNNSRSYEGNYLGFLDDCHYSYYCRNQDNDNNDTDISKVEETEENWFN